MARVTITLEFDGPNLLSVTGAGGSTCGTRALTELSPSEQELFAQAEKAGLSNYVTVIKTQDIAAAQCCTLCRLPSGAVVRCCWPC
jgi:hypothetical protein